MDVLREALIKRMRSKFAVRITRTPRCACAGGPLPLLPPRTAHTGAPEQHETAGHGGSSTTGCLDAPAPAVIADPRATRAHVLSVLQELAADVKAQEIITAEVTAFMVSVGGIRVRYRRA